jgi:hypothetical protein
VDDRHSQIVDVDLAALPLGLLQFIGREPTDNRVVFQRGESNEIFAAEQTLEIARSSKASPKVVIMASISATSTSLSCRMLKGLEGDMVGLIVSAARMPELF